jgi:hypothetical protein
VVRTARLPRDRPRRRLLRPRRSFPAGHPHAGQAARRTRSRSTPAGPSDAAHGRGPRP